MFSFTHPKLWDLRLWRFFHLERFIFSIGLKFVLSHQNHLYLHLQNRQSFDLLKMNTFLFKFTSSSCQTCQIFVETYKHQGHIFVKIINNSISFLIAFKLNWQLGTQDLVQQELIELVLQNAVLLFQRSAYPYDKYK